MRRLGPGEALIIEPHRVRTAHITRYTLCERGDGRSPADLETELTGLVRQAVVRNVVDVDRSAVFLSGGVDSRAIAAVAAGVARQGGRPITTVTWAAPGARPGSDVEVARRVANALGTHHCEVPLRGRQASHLVRSLVRNDELLARGL
jgi:asparagine synthetase B (glutamine-hydrolysing)